MPKKYYFRISSISWKVLVNPFFSNCITCLFLYGYSLNIEQ
jgi:hypothetical protein